jgi:MFS family permease
LLSVFRQKDGFVNEFESGSAQAIPLNQQGLSSAAAIPAQPPRSEEIAVPARKTDRRFVTGALMLVMVLASMEMTVTSTAMPTIIGELHGLEHYAWVASVYLLACTVTMPLYGRLSDVLGRKLVIMGAIFIFTGGSVLAAYAHTMTQLILFRGVQGLGAGGIMPVALTILGDIFTVQERAKIQGAFSAVWGLSSLAGPALGAFIVHTMGWRWVFLVNLPFGFLGMAVLVWKYHDRQKPHSTSLDLPGIGALSLGSMTLLALVSRMGPDGWNWPMTVVLLAVTLGCAGFFVWQERRTINPVMPPDLMLRREIGPSILATFFFGAAFLCLDTYVPLYVQGGRGGGAAAAAGVVTPVMMTWALSGVIAAPLIIKWGFRKTALAGSILIIIGFTGLFVGAYTNAPRGLLTAVLAITGFGFGPTSMSYLIAAQDAVEWQQRGIVTSSISFFRTIGGAVGIGLLGAAFNFLSRHDMENIRAMGVSPGAAMDPHLQHTLTPESIQLVQHMISSGLLWVFAAMLAIAVLQFFCTFLMRDAKPGHPVSRTEAFDASCA